jgi:hypothetical protein
MDRIANRRPLLGWRFCLLPMSRWFWLTTRSIRRQVMQLCNRIQQRVPGRWQCTWLQAGHL